MIRQKDLFLEKSLEIGWRSLLTSSISSVLVASVIAVDAAIMGSIAISGAGCSSVYVIAKAAFDKLSPLNRLTGLIVSVAAAMFVIFSSLPTLCGVIISAKVAVCLGGLHFITNIVLSSLINKKSENSPVENLPSSIEKALLSTKSPQEKISRSYKWMKEAVLKKELLAKSEVIVSSALALSLISYGLYSLVQVSFSTEGSYPSPDQAGFSGDPSSTLSQHNDILSAQISTSDHNLGQQISNAISRIVSGGASTSSSTKIASASSSSGVQTIVSNEISKPASASTSSINTSSQHNETPSAQISTSDHNLSQQISNAISGIVSGGASTSSSTKIASASSSSGVQTIVSNEISKLASASSSSLLKGFSPQKPVHWEMIGLGMTATAVVVIGLFALRAGLLKRKDQTAIVVPKTGSAGKENVALLEGGGRNDSSIGRSGASAFPLKTDGGNSSSSGTGVSGLVSSFKKRNFGDDTSSSVSRTDLSSDVVIQGDPDPSFMRYTTQSPSPHQSPSRKKRTDHDEDGFDLVELSSISHMGEGDDVGSVSAALFPYEAFQANRCNIVPLTEIQPYPIYVPHVDEKRAARGSLNHSATAKQVSLRQDAQPSEGEEIGVYIQRVFSSYQAPEGYPRGFVISVPSINLKIDPHPLVDFFTKYSQVLKTCGITRIYLEEILGADTAEEEENLPYKYHQYFQEEEKEPPQRNPTLKALFPLAKNQGVEVAGLRVKLSNVSTKNYHCETEKAKNFVSYGAGLILAQQEPFIAFVTTSYAKGTNSYPGFSQLLGCPSIGMRAIPGDPVQNGMHGYGSTAYSVDARFSS